MAKRNVFEERIEAATEELADERLRRGHPELRIVKHNDEHVPFYSEITIEKFCTFLPNNFRKKSITIERVYKDQQGDLYKQSVSVGLLPNESKEYGVLKVKHLDILYSILKIWADQGWRAAEIDGEYFGVVSTTRYELLKNTLKPKATWSKQRYDKVIPTLHDLKAVPFLLTAELINEHDPSGTENQKPEKSEEQVLYILSDFRYEKAGRSKEEEGGNIRILISPYVTKKFYRQDVKVIRMDVYRALNSDISKILYPLLDRNLPHTTKFKKKLRDLCIENGFAHYDKESLVKAKWKDALAELNGIELSCGKSLGVDIRQGKQGKGKGWFFFAWIIDTHGDEFPEKIF